MAIAELKLCKNIYPIIPRSRSDKSAETYIKQFLKEMFDQSTLFIIQSESRSKISFLNINTLNPGVWCLNIPENNDLLQYMYSKIEPVHEGMCDQQSLRPACAYAQSDQSLC